MKYCYDYPRPAVSVDAAILRKAGDEWQILLIQRGIDPFKGMWALPGGFVNLDETLEEAAARELMEETGLKGIELEQVHTFSALDRDPRHRTIGTVYKGIISAEHSEAQAGDDASDAKWFQVDQLPELAFDHAEVINVVLSSL
jgi:8-oxo-dGTP diphosphatase